MIKLFADRYYSLIEYCSRADFDQGVFRLKHDEYAKAFSKLSYEHSGEVVHEIVRRRNEAH